MALAVAKMSTLYVAKSCDIGREARGSTPTICNGVQASQLPSFCSTSSFQQGRGAVSMSRLSKVGSPPAHRMSKSVMCVTSVSGSEGKESEREERSWVQGGVLALAAAGAALMLSGASVMAEGDFPFQTYYGTAASASSYGGYGGNASKKDSAEYIFDVPQGWKERLISKVEKGTNGTDSEFYNPKKKEEKTYLTYLSGFRKLGPRDNVLNNLALSDVNLQDIIGLAADIKAEDKTENGQLYYVFEIDSPVAHELIKVTCTKNKLYSHFVKAPASDWARDKDMLRHMHDSFQTIGGNEPLPIF